MIIILEGLPSVGKSTIVATLQARGITTVEEVIADTENHLDRQSQEFFMNSDTTKVSTAIAAEKALVVMDRGPISTLAYNLTKHKIDKSFDFMPSVTWFTTMIPFYERDDVRTIYLQGKSALPYTDANDPYGSEENQKLLEEITLQLINLFTLHAATVRYDYASDQGKFIDEILDQYMRA